jgi:hypothetical protein
MKDDQFGFRTRLRLMEERKKAGGTLNWPEVDRILQECYDESVKSFTAVHPAPKRPRTMIGQCDEEWIAELESDSAFAGIDIKRELGKAQAWAKYRGKLTTRRSFVNWLLKAERTVGYDGTGKSSTQPTATLNPYAEPQNWREKARQALGDVELPETWSELGLQNRKTILARTS